VTRVARGVKKYNCHPWGTQGFHKKIVSQFGSKMKINIFIKENIFKLYLLLG